MESCGDTIGAVRPFRTVKVTRYVTPLREGGSLPAIVEADDDGLYVLKFRGAGHGEKALIAELVVGELARATGLPVPEIVFAELDQDLARTEPDPEIHALIHDSVGLNVALDYLPGSVNFDPVVHRLPTELASRIVWFDALVSNVDRTPRNTNMLMWHGAPWLIDHGSALYFHHTPGWEDDVARPQAPFDRVRDHMLLRGATTLPEADRVMTTLLTPDVVARVVALVPDAWLGSTAGDVASGRRAYQQYFEKRLQAPRHFVEEAARAR
jgi:hypothetical protein